MPRDSIKRPLSELSAGSGAPSSKNLINSLALSNSEAWSVVSKMKEEHHVQAAGMIKVIPARVIKEELAWAAVTWKVDSEK